MPHSITTRQFLCGQTQWEQVCPFPKPNLPHLLPFRFALSSLRNQPPATTPLHQCSPS